MKKTGMKRARREVNDLAEKRRGREQWLGRGGMGKRETGRKIGEGEREKEARSKDVAQIT